MSVRRLYHFTHETYVEDILALGLLPLAEKIERNMIPRANIDALLSAPEETQIGDIFVWLTRSPVLNGSGAATESANGDQVRMTVEVEAERWQDAADRHGVSEEWRRALRRASGGNPGEWYVVEGVIPPEQIIAVERWS
jgi:hypothetical protein